MAVGGDAVAVAMRTDAFTDIWVFDLVRGTSSRLTAGGANHGFPVWSQNDRELAFLFEVPSRWVLQLLGECRRQDRDNLLAPQARILGAIHFAHARQGTFTSRTGWTPER
jgi:Tol biopolymer transport system component